MVDQFLVELANHPSNEAIGIIVSAPKAPVKNNNLCKGLNHHRAFMVLVSNIIQLGRDKNSTANHK